MSPDVDRSTASGGIDPMVLCAGNEWDDTKVADQQMAEQLARSRPVLYVDPPVSIVRALARRAPADRSRRPTAVGPNLWRVTPLVGPYPGRPWSIPVSNWLLVKQIERAVRSLGSSGCDVVTAWPLYDVSSIGGARSCVYWAQDDFVGLAEIHGQDQRLVAAKETEVAAHADVVVASSPLVSDVHAAAGREVRLIPFGCDTEQFDSTGPPAPDVGLDRPTAGVIGRFNARTDLDLLFAVAAHVRLLLVGPLDPSFDTVGFRDLVDLETVQWVGPKPYGDLPAYYRCVDVGLVPYADTAFNRGSFPLKLLEYLAAGVPVVSTDLPAAHWLDTPLIRIAADERGFLDAVDDALDEGMGTSIVAERRAFAQSHTWRSRASRLEEVIGQAQRSHARADPGAFGVR